MRRGWAQRRGTHAWTSQNVPPRSAQIRIERSGTEGMFNVGFQCTTLRDTVQSRADEGVMARLWRRESEGVRSSRTAGHFPLSLVHHHLLDG
jgi:hypothetical protein